MSSIAVVDSLVFARKKLSATPLEAGRLALLEEKRKKAKVPQALLASMAAMSLRSYTYLLADPDRAATAIVDRLERAFDRLGKAPRTDLLEVELVRATYRGFVVVLCDHFDVTPDDVAGADPRAGATADPHWRACAHVRQAAIYLTNTALGLKQRRLAEVLELTPAAVCLALQAVEDRRDDPEFDAAIRRAARTITGRDDE
jgi:hypothetical protein